jgi:hypothetical protein
MYKQSLDFAKPKLFFKNIGHYVANCTYIHVSILFNFTTVFNNKTLIAGVYAELLDQNEEPSKAIAKSVTNVSLEDLQDIIKALPQK